MCQKYIDKYKYKIYFHLKLSHFNEFWLKINSTKYTIILEFKKSLRLGNL